MIQARRLVLLFMLSTLVTCYGAQKKTTAQPRFTISGHIHGMAPPRQALLVATAPHKPSHSVRTRPDGSYILRAVTPGTYNVRPSHGSFSFSPSFHTVAVTTHDVQGVDFTAHERARPAGRR